MATVEDLKRLLKENQVSDEEKALMLAALKPEPRFPVPRTLGGGIERALTLDHVLERAEEMGQEGWTPRPGSFYLSSIGRCFRKVWYEAKKAMPDDGVPNTRSPDSKYRFDPGNSEPGHAAEDRIELLMREVYSKGGPGSVLKDVRVSTAIEVEVPDGKGGHHVETAYLSGKSDIVVLGDNMTILDFMELKSPIYWPKKKSGFLARNPKTVPLSIAKIEEPSQPDGIANFDNILQLAVPVQILRDNGIKVRKVTLLYVCRERFREHIEILLTDKEVEFLYEIGKWWVAEAHLNSKSDTPPPSTFLMGYECTYCPWANRCAAEDKKTGARRQISDVVVGINARLQAANGGA